MEVKYIPKEQLRHYWDFVKYGLEKVRCKGHIDWIVEDVYCDCFEQRSMLWLVERDGVGVGFMVMQPLGKTMHLWAAWLESNNPDDLADGLIHAQSIARQGGCEKLTFSSVRKGWDRRAKQLGFSPSTWEIKV
jgi:hypothetical protein